ncbi:MAG: hypothetical protein KUG71_14675 [Porticoccaceae bacterium]|nr:hypothetical protein [Porticoccaceae bacterium]
MKTLLKIIALLVLVVAILVGVGIYFLDSGIKTAVETFGPQYTRTDVSLGGAKLSPWSGEGSLRNLVVANPDGFKTPNAFSLGEIAITLDTDSLTADPIVVTSLRILAPEITYEQGKSSTNLQQLQKNVEQSVGSTAAPSDADTDTSGTGTKLIIKELLISGGKIHYSNPLLGGKTVDVALPEIKLSGIGEKSNGATGAEVAEQILAAINKDAMSAVLDAGALKAVGQQVEQRLKDEKGKLEESLGGLKGLLGK